MTFVHSAGTITQSGTDTSLAGLTGVTGVTTTSELRRTVYTINASTLLSITGTLSWDPEEEVLELLSDTDGFLEITGTVTMGRVVSTNPDGSQRLSRGVGLRMNGDTNNSTEDRARVLTGGSFTALGGEVETAGVFAALGTGTITATETVFRNVSTSLEFQLARNETDPANVVLNNVVLDGVEFSGRLFQQNGINTFSGEFRNCFLQPRFGTHTAALVLNNVSFGSNAASLDWQVFGSTTADQSQATEVTNADIGTNFRIGHALPVRTGHIAIFQDVDITVLDTSNNPIQFAEVRIATTDSTNRVNATRTDATGLFQNNRDFSGSTFDEYSGATDASGVLASQKVLLGRYWDEDGVAENIQTDLYSKSQTAGNDNFDIFFISYGENIFSGEYQLRGNTATAITQILTGDSLITESNRATVDAYTTLDNPQEVYDYAKSQLVSNYNRETQTTVTRVGNQLDVRALNIVIDATASAVWDLTGGTLTIRSSAFTGDITTTGTVTTSNGATVTGTIVDANRDSSLSEANGATFTVYNTEADRDARTNAVVSNVTSYSFLFSALTANPVFLWVTSGATELPTSVTLVQGANTIDLGTGGVLNSLTNLIQYIPAKIYINIAASANGTGTITNPFNNLSDALTLSDTVGTRTLVFLQDIMLDRDLEGFRIEGAADAAVLNVNNFSLEGSLVSGLDITGTAAVGTNGFQLHKCSIENLVNMQGTYTQCFLKGTNVVADGVDLVMQGVSSAQAGLSRPTVSLAGVTSANISVRDYKGGLNLTNSTDAGNELTISGDEMTLVVDSTNTAGSLVARGVADFQDSSGAGLSVNTDALLDPGNTVGDIATDVILARDYAQQASLKAQPTK